MLKISYAGCLGLSAAISAKCALLPKVEKTSKLLILRVYSHLRSSMLTPLKSLSPVLVMIAVCLCLCATVFTLDELIAAK